MNRLLPRLRQAVKPFLVLCVLMLVLEIPVGADEPATLRQGASGVQVLQVQSALGVLGLYRSSIDGKFGQATELAVRIFQHNYGLKVDGVVGHRTWDKLLGFLEGLDKHVYQLRKGETIWSVAKQFDLPTTELVRINQVKDPSRLPVGFTVKLPEDLFQATAAREVQVIPWERVNAMFKVGEIVQVTDLETSRSFRVKRFGGSLHADVEPLTAADTAQLKAIYGGVWSWRRRAVIVDLRGLKIAASINGFPHGFQHIANGFPGHFCIHFLGSRIHKSRREDADHQRMVLAAAGLEFF